MTRTSAGLALDPDVVDALRARLPEVAERTVAAVTRDVGEYRAVEEQVGENIRQAVRLALATFLRLAAEPAGPGTAEDPMQPAVEGAYALGRGEARSGRTMDALLAAYRVGARTAWQEWAGAAVAVGMRADTVARFAELV
ncbi:MAG TPA: PucR family transcriptional regulator, partial [Mycobacteriales bacterium]|nr:PucR family transcriptional regulator [Mycobacteriales bacterium]